MVESPAFSLADVLEQAPTVLEVLHRTHPRSLNALRATNKGLCDVVQQTVTHIFMFDPSDVSAFNGSRWPNLQRITFLSHSDLATLLPEVWQHACVHTTFAKPDTGTVQAMRESKWPAQLITGLYARFPSGSSADMNILSAHPWPVLEALELVSAGITDASAALIFRADWPQLQRLSLQNNQLKHLPGLDENNSWQQIDFVSFVENAINDTGLERLASARWPKLHCLDLRQDSSAYDQERLTWNQLSVADWPMLSSLNLGWNVIGGTAMKTIVDAQLSLIRSLDLAGNNIDSIAIGHLVKGSWTALLSLTLCYSHRKFHKDCLKILATGPWQQLTSLCLAGNGLDATALPALSKGKWPCLYDLDLHSNSLSTSDFTIMLGSGDSGVDQSQKPKDICRKFWPKLHSLCY